MNEEIRYRNYILDKVQNSISIGFESSDAEDISLNIDNIGALLTSLGISKGDSEILDLTRNALIDSNGVINPLDLEKALVNISLENGDDEEEYFEEAFAIIDLDNDGYVTAPDIYRLFQKLNIKISDEGLITLLKNIDYDKDGRIDFEDFRSFMLGLKYPEPEINVQGNCGIDDDEEDDNDEDDNSGLHVAIEALRERRPSLRKLTKEDSQFHLVSEKKRNLFSYAGVVKETSAVVSYLRRCSQTCQSDVDSIREEIETVSQDTLSPRERNSVINDDNNTFSAPAVWNSLAPSSPSRRRSFSRESSPARNSLFPERPSSRRNSTSSTCDLDDQNFLSVAQVNFSRRPSLDGSGRSRHNSLISPRSSPRSSTMRQTIPKTVVEPAEEKDSQMDQDNDELLCLKDLCLTIGDEDQINGNDGEVTVSQTVNGLVEHANDMVEKLLSNASLESSSAYKFDSKARSPGSQKRQLSAESTANEYREKDSPQKYSRDCFDPDNMTTASRNTLYEFHKITSPSSNSIDPETLREDKVHGNMGDPVPPGSKRTDMKPFFAAKTVTQSKASATATKPRSKVNKKGTDSEYENDDMHISLVEKYHRPHRRISRRRSSTDSRTFGKCLKIRTLKKTKSFSKSKKELLSTGSTESSSSEIHVPTAGPDEDVENEQKRLREERLKNFTETDKKSGYVKSKNFEIPIVDSPRTPTFPNPKKRLSSSLNSRPQTARQMRYTYPREYILGDAVTSKQLSNSMNSPRTLEEYNGIHSGYIVGHITFEKPTINGMQPLKTRKDSAPGISTWQHEFPSVSPPASRPKTAIGIKRALLSQSNKYLNRPFTARTSTTGKSLYQSERDSMISSNETLSSHTINENIYKSGNDYSHSTSRQAECGDSNDSTDNESNEETSDLGNSFNEEDIKFAAETNTCELSEETRHGCKFIPTEEQSKGGEELQATPPKSPFKKSSVVPKSPLLVTRRSYPLGGRDEPLSDQSMAVLHRPHTARPVKTVYQTQHSHPPDSSIEAGRPDTVRPETTRPKTAGPARRQSINSTPMSLNVVDMSPRSPSIRPKTARIKDRRGSMLPSNDSAPDDRFSLQFTEPVQTQSLDTNKAITNSFPVSAVRRRKSLGGNLTPSREDDTGPKTPINGVFNFDESIEGDSLTPRSPTISILRRPKSSLNASFSKTSVGASEVSVVNMPQALEDGIATAKTQRKCSFKPLTRAIMALNQTRRILENSSISRSLETKSILLQHDDLSKTKKVPKPDTVPVIQENALAKTKTVITLEIPQI